MSEPYIGEIRLVGFNFAPVGWALCDGSLLPISENETLFTLIGTTYGGDGQSTFAVPDLRGRAPLHMGTGTSGTTYVIGQAGGAEEVTLSVQQMPPHTHAVAAASTRTSSLPVGTAAAPGGAYAPKDGPALPASGFSGGSQPHTNMQPYLTVNYIISLFGVFPSQS